MREKQAQMDEFTARQHFDRMQDRFQSGRFSWQRSQTSFKAKSAGNSFNPDNRSKAYDAWTREQSPLGEPVSDSVSETDRALIVLGLRGFSVTNSADFSSRSTPLTMDVLKKAYQKKAMDTHPDHSGGNEDRFREVTEAYNTLKGKLGA